MKPLFLPLIVLPTITFAAGTPQTFFQCPERITTEQSLHEKQPGWRESTERPVTPARRNDVGYSEHNLDFVDFSEGPPEERGYLQPDRETKVVHGQSTATWVFHETTPVWFSCRYRGTAVILAKQLSADVRTCSVSYDRNRGISVRKVWCE